MGAPGWITKACKKMQGQTTSANCSIAQRAALVALNSGTKSAIEMKNEYLKVEAVYSHLACSNESDSNQNTKQIERRTEKSPLMIGMEQISSSYSAQ